MTVTIFWQVPAILPANGVELLGGQPCTRRHPVSSGWPSIIEINHADDILLFYQSQLDTDGQGVLKNIGVTSARISIAGAFTVALNMIIKVSIWRRI